MTSEKTASNLKTAYLNGTALTTTANKHLQLELI
jgi:hypothetical protein